MILRLFSKLFVLTALMLNINCLALFGFVESSNQNITKYDFATILTQKCSNHNENKSNYNIFSASSKDEEVLYDLKLKFLDFDSPKKYLITFNVYYKYFKNSDTEKLLYVSNYYHNLVWIIKSNT